MTSALGKPASSSISVKAKYVTSWHRPPAYTSLTAMGENNICSLYLLLQSANIYLWNVLSRFLFSSRAATNRRWVLITASRSRLSMEQIVSILLASKSYHGHHVVTYTSIRVFVICSSYNNCSILMLHSIFNGHQRQMRSFTACVDVAFQYECICGIYRDMTSTSTCAMNCMGTPTQPSSSMTSHKRHRLIILKHGWKSWRNMDLKVP